MVLKDLYVKDDAVLSCRFNEEAGRAEIKTVSGDMLFVKCNREEFLKAVGCLPDTVKGMQYLQDLNTLIAELKGAVNG